MPEMPLPYTTSARTDHIAADTPDAFCFIFSSAGNLPLNSSPGTAFRSPDGGSLCFHSPLSPF
jgi:hypothetical protein